MTPLSLASRLGTPRVDACTPPKADALPSVILSGQVADEEDALALLLPDTADPEPRVTLLVEVPVDVAVAVVPAALDADAGSLMCAAAEAAESQPLHRPAVASTLGAVGAWPASAAVADAALSPESRPSAILSEPFTDEKDAPRIRPSSDSTLEGADAA